MVSVEKLGFDGVAMDEITHGPGDEERFLRFSQSKPFWDQFSKIRVKCL